MKRESLSMTGYFDKGKKTKREQFLAEMDQVLPWERLLALIGGRLAPWIPPAASPVAPPRP